MTEEIITLLTIIRHINELRRNLHKFSYRIEQRSLLHDSSKFALDEFSKFVEINKVAREKPFGSDEYLQSIKNEAVQLHYTRNSYYPEHYQEGFEAMSLLDIVEMICDWKAAADTYGGSFLESLEVQKKRYNFNSEQWYLIQRIVQEILS